MPMQAYFGRVTFLNQSPRDRSPCQSAYLRRLPCGAAPRPNPVPLLPVVDKNSVVVVGGDRGKVAPVWRERRAHDRAHALLVIDPPNQALVARVPHAHERNQPVLRNGKPDMRSEVLVKDGPLGFAL